MSGHAVTAERHGRKSMVWGRGRASGGIAWWKSLLGRINGSSKTRMPTPEPGKTTHTTYTLPAWQWDSPAAPNECAQSDATSCDDLLMYDKRGWWRNEESLLFTFRLKSPVWKFPERDKAADLSKRSRWNGNGREGAARAENRFHIIYFPHPSLRYPFL